MTNRGLLTKTIFAPGTLKEREARVTICKIPTALPHLPAQQPNTPNDQDAAAQFSEEIWGMDEATSVEKHLYHE
jgi:hypothetical protein